MTLGKAATNEVYVPEVADRDFELSGNIEVQKAAGHRLSIGGTPTSCQLG
jgi:hypothetical protein